MYALKPSLLILVLCGCTAFAACAAKQPFDAHRCARSCIDMANACKSSCLRTTDPSGLHPGSGASCERTCQTQRDTCDLQCMQGKEPEL